MQKGTKSGLGNDRVVWEATVFGAAGGLGQRRLRGSQVRSVLLWCWWEGCCSDLKLSTMRLPSSMTSFYQLKSHWFHMTFCYNYTGQFLTVASAHDRTVNMADVLGYSKHCVLHFGYSQRRFFFCPYIVQWMKIRLWYSLINSLRGFDDKQTSCFLSDLNAWTLR